MLAMCLPVLTLVSCGDDDKAPACNYQWGIYSDGEVHVRLDANHQPSPLYTWLEDEITTLNKTYEGKQRTSNEETVLSRLETADKALADLKARFDEWKKTKDAGQLDFSKNYLFRVLKDGQTFKETKSYPFVLDYKGNTRVDADSSFVVEATVPLTYAKEISGDLKMSVSNMGLIDGANLKIELAGEPTLVNAETLEFAKGTFLSNFTMELVDGYDYHLFQMVYKLDRTSVETWKGNWYMLLPVRMTEEMVLDVKIPVIVK